MNFDEDLNNFQKEKKKAPRNKLQREAHYAVITELYLQGKSQNHIAKVIGISQPQVAQDIEKIRKRWATENIDRNEEIKLEQLKKIDLIEAEAWDCWHKSKRTRVSKVKRGGIKNNLPTGSGQFETMEEEELGDTRYLSEIRWCITERLKIIGGYAAFKVAATDPTGTKEAGQVSREEITSWLDNIAYNLSLSIEKTPAKQNLGDYVDGLELPQTALAETNEELEIIDVVNDNDDPEYVPAYAQDLPMIRNEDVVLEKDANIKSHGTAQDDHRLLNDIRTSKDMDTISANANPLADLIRNRRK